MLIFPRVAPHRHRPPQSVENARPPWGRNLSRRSITAGFSASVDLNINLSAADEELSILFETRFSLLHPRSRSNMAA